MATRVTHTPRPPADDPAAEQLDELVDALHESGLLRVLTAAVRSYPELAEMVVTRLDADRVRTLVELGDLADVLTPEGTRRLVAGARAAATAADDAVASEPPSLLGLARSLNDPDVRRGAGAVVAALGAFGRAVAHEHGSTARSEPGRAQTSSNQPDQASGGGTLGPGSRPSQVARTR
jgi:uncharacterized protein YjgD (DUF1641 family)